MADPWVFDPRIDAGAFKALGYAASSAGITERQREYRDGWWAHAKRSKSFILDAALRVQQTRLAVVLGAGKAYDLPLAELAQRFERVVAIDIDAGALAATVRSAVRERGLLQKIEPRPMDLTGVTRQLVESLEAAATPAAFGDLCRAYRLATPPRFLEQPADLLVSALVLTQLALPLKLLARRLFESRFGAMPAPLVADWDAFDLRMQQDHIDALPRQASLAVLISEVTHRVSTGESWSLIGSGNLAQRVPAGVRIVTQANWQWPRIRATRESPGALMDVEALVLSSAP
jgi:hypothetical protein